MLGLGVKQLNQFYRLPKGCSGKEFACQCRGHRDAGSIPGSRRSPGVGNGNTVILPRKFRGQKSLSGYSPWGCTELDTTEHPRTHAHALFKSLYPYRPLQSVK